MSRNSHITAVRNLISERTHIKPHPHRDAYIELGKKDDVELMGIIRTATTKRGARVMASTWAANKMRAVQKKIDAHEDEADILAKELAGGLSIKRFETVS